MTPATSKTVVVPVRIPADIYAAMKVRIHAEDLSFSRYMRRALRRELQASGWLQSKASLDFVDGLLPEIEGGPITLRNMDVAGRGTSGNYVGTRRRA